MKIYQISQTNSIQTGNKFLGQYLMKMGESMRMPDAVFKIIAIDENEKSITLKQIREPSPDRTVLTWEDAIAEDADNFIGDVGKQSRGVVNPRSWDGEQKLVSDISESVWNEAESIVNDLYTLNTKDPKVLGSYYYFFSLGEDGESIDKGNFYHEYDAFLNGHVFKPESIYDGYISLDIDRLTHGYGWIRDILQAFDYTLIDQSTAMSIELRPNTTLGQELGWEGWEEPNPQRQQPKPEPKPAFQRLKDLVAKHIQDPNILNLISDLSPETYKQVFRALVNELHPDKHPEDKSKYEEAFKEFQDIHSQLPEEITASMSKLLVRLAAF